MMPTITITTTAAILSKAKDLACAGIGKGALLLAPWNDTRVSTQSLTV